MAVSQDQLKQTYKSKDTDWLLDLYQKGGLTEEAATALLEEFVTRGVSEEKVEELKKQYHEVTEPVGNSLEGGDDPVEKKVEKKSAGSTVGIPVGVLLFVGALIVGACFVIIYAFQGLEKYGDNDTAVVASIVGIAVMLWFIKTMLGVLKG